VPPLCLLFCLFPAQRPTLEPFLHSIGTYRDLQAKVGKLTYVCKVDRITGQEHEHSDAAQPRHNCSVQWNVAVLYVLMLCNVVLYVCPSTLSCVMSCYVVLCYLWLSRCYLMLCCVVLLVIATLYLAVRTYDVVCWLALWSLLCFVFEIVTLCNLMSCYDAGYVTKCYNVLCNVM
jgi:hypothetical protein